MAHYAYKCACYDIDYPKFQQLVKQFEEQEGRKFDGDSNYDGDNWYIMEMWIRELRAENERLRASPASAPEGWKLVPFEPTDAMIECGCRALGALYGQYGASEAYRAMLAAAPTPPVSEDRNKLELYGELLYAVASKFPGESRHQTALRYIRNAEKGSGNTATQEDKP